jgi:hypothetical protein
MCSVWGMDGTFHIVSKLFTQLVTIHGVTQDGWIFPLVYALLPDKKTTSFKYLFEELSKNEYGAILRPDIVLLDFEKASMRAVREVYPEVELQGCHFHFIQSLYRNFPENVKKEYKNNLNFAVYMKRNFALAFVHPNQVEQAFADIPFQVKTEFSFLKPELKVFVACMKNTYIGDQYSPPLYLIKFWSVHARVLMNTPRTNNAIESCNRRINTLAETSHLPLYRLITTIKEEQHNTEVFMARREGGEPIKSKKWKQVRLNNRLFHLVSTYNERELDAFVRGIAVNMCNLRYTSRSKLPSEVITEDPSLLDTQLIGTQPIPPVPGTSTCTFAPQFSTNIGRKRKHTNAHPQSNKRVKSV